jgi:hypothetical protein
MNFRPRHISEEELTQMQQRVRSGVVEMRGGHPITHAYNPKGSKAASASSPYKSKWEAAYASKLELEKRAGLIKAYWYEPFSLWLPGKVRYKPDFLVQYSDSNMIACGNDHYRQPPLELIEVKGWSKNRRDGMTRLKIAAALFPCFVWRMVYRTEGGGWSGEYV